MKRISPWDDNFKTTDNNNLLPDQMTIPSMYPDVRYVKTNLARPADLNVDKARAWTQDHQL